MTRKAAENAEGEESRSCSVCGKTESRPIPVLSPEKGINPESHEKPGNKEPQNKPKKPVPPGQSGNPVSPDNSPSYEAPAQMAYAPGPETAVPPQTGDDSQCILWVTLICLSLLSLMTISSRRAE